MASLKKDKEDKSFVVLGKRKSTSIYAREERRRVTSTNTTSVVYVDEVENSTMLGHCEEVSNNSNNGHDSGSDGNQHADSSSYDSNALNIPQLPATVYVEVDDIHEYEFDRNNSDGNSDYSDSEDDESTNHAADDDKINLRGKHSRHVCQECGFSFVHAAGLKKHMRKHSRRRLNRRYRQPQQLKFHEKQGSK